MKTASRPPRQTKSWCAFCRRCGFTLVELLIVLAVIAVVAGVLIPVYSQTREKARMASCASNLRQTGAAIQMYAHDYDEAVVPYQMTLNPAKAYNAMWWGLSKGLEGADVDSEYGLLRPYLKNDPLKLCPDAADMPVPLPGEWPVSYGYNKYIADANAAREYPALANFDNAAETVLLADSAYLYGGRLNRNFYLYYPSADSDDAPDIHGRHNGMAICVWLDGHVTAAVPIPKPAASNAGLKQANGLGDLLKGGVRTGVAWRDDYYFLANKSTTDLSQFQ